MDYYKITNKEEIHYGLKYHDGLNVDPLDFNPSGDCRPGGIYFTREDILAFLDNGVWLRKVKITKRTPVYLNPGTPIKWKAKEVMLEPRERINVGTIERLLLEGANPKAEDSYALRWAARYGHAEVAKLLIPVSDPKARNSLALWWAVRYGHAEVVKLLIPVSDPKAEDSYVRWAARYGHAEVVKILSKQRRFYGKDTVL